MLLYASAARNTNVMQKLLSTVCIGALLMAGVHMHAQFMVSMGMVQAAGTDTRFPAAVALPHNTLEVYKDINIRAVRNFKNTYKTVENETWCVLQAGYRARFQQQGTTHIVTYNKRGNWLYTIRQYDESLMDPGLRAMVKTVYYDYRIFLVEEVERPARSVWHLVHMEDNSSWKNIRIYENEMETVLDMQKL